MADISQLEVVRGLHYWSGPLVDHKPESLSQLPALDTNSMVHDFGVTHAEAAEEALRQSQLRQNMNMGVGRGLNSGQVFGRQGLALAVEPESGTVVASLLFADNVSSSRPSLLGVIERQVKLRSRTAIGSRYHLLGWRAVAPDLLPEDPKILSKRFSVIDALILFSFRGKNYTQPVRSYPWIGPGNRGEHWWMATLRGAGLRRLEPYKDKKVRPFDSRGDVFQQTWGTDSMAIADGTIHRKKGAGPGWIAAERNLQDKLSSL